MAKSKGSLVKPKRVGLVKSKGALVKPPGVIDKIQRGFGNKNQGGFVKSKVALVNSQGEKVKSKGALAKTQGGMGKL